MGVHERLWCSVVLQAMADLEEGERIAYYEKHNPKKLSASSIAKREDIVAYSQGARDWFDSKDTHVGSFKWICDVCGLDAERLWEFSLTKAGRQKFLKAAPSDNKRAKKKEEDEEE